MKFRFLDEVVSFDRDGSGSIVTSKTFSQTEDYLEGPFHPPSRIPSSLVLETMAASGGRLIEIVSQDNAFGILLRVEEARFFSPVGPGDQVLVRSELLGIQDQRGELIGLARTQSQAFVEDKPVAEACIVFLCVPVKEFK
ncbi:MAG: hypothetical protein O7B35_17425 [Deltaproteobacteria bacterium]|nr:hypothetical protein [Deltaproteobacteria bacterium]